MNKDLCFKIASDLIKYESIIATAESEEERIKAQEEIENICSQFDSLYDMIQIDDEVQRLLSQFIDIN